MHKMVMGNFSKDEADLSSRLSKLTATGRTRAPSTAPGNPPATMVGRTSDGHSVFSDGKVEVSGSGNHDLRIDMEKCRAARIGPEDLYLKEGKIQSLTLDRMIERKKILEEQLQSGNQNLKLDEDFMVPVVAAYNHRYSGFNLHHAANTGEAVAMALTSLSGGGNSHARVLCRNTGHYTAMDFYRHPQGDITALVFDALRPIPPKYFADEVAAAFPPGGKKEPIAGAKLYGLGIQYDGSGCTVMSMDILRSTLKERMEMERLHAETLELAGNEKAQPPSGWCREGRYISNHTSSGFFKRTEPAGDAFMELPTRFGRQVQSSSRLDELLERNPDPKRPVNKKGAELPPYWAEKTGLNANTDRVTRMKSELEQVNREMAALRSQTGRSNLDRLMQLHGKKNELIRTMEKIRTNTDFNKGFLVDSARIKMYKETVGFLESALNPG